MPRLTFGRLSMLSTIAIVLVLYGKGGGKMFSTGPLSEKTRGSQTLGGVSSHAEIGGNCGACHASPLGGQTMADRCLDCHANVREQLSAERAFHGRIPGGKDCRQCHTEHKGPHADITSFADFDHNWTAFTLTGQHQKAECRACVLGVAQPYKALYHGPHVVAEHVGGNPGFG